VSSHLDYLILRRWDEDDFLRFLKAAGIKFDAHIQQRIQSDVAARVGNLFVVRRLDLSARGTSVLAFYSRVKAAPSKLMWSLDLPDWKAKLLTMYLNSTFNILQTLLLRSETRGAFMEISKYILSEFKVPDLEQFSGAKVKRLIATFNLVRDAKLPSILEQLKTKHPVRRRIDIVWLDAMDMKEEKKPIE